MGTGRELAFSVPHGASRQVALDTLALKPYWGKPAVRNFREGDGDVGIMRSPVRAITPPDRSGDVFRNVFAKDEDLVPIARIGYAAAR